MARHRQVWRSLTLDDLFDHRPDLILEILEARAGDDPRLDELFNGDYPEDWRTGEAEAEGPELPVREQPAPANPVPEFTGPHTHRWASVQKLRCPWPWQVRFSELAWRKYWAYAWADQDKEISGFGLLEYDGPPVPNQPWTATVIDLWFLSSFDSSTSSVIPAEAQAQLQMKLLREGRDLNKLRLWWHSHHRLSTFWSGTDVRAIGELMEGQAMLSEHQGGWMVSSVCAFPRDILVRVDFWRKVGPQIDGVCIDHVPVCGPDGAVLTEIECFEEVAARRRGRWDNRPFRVVEAPRVGSSGPVLQPALLPGIAPLAEAARNNVEAESCTHSRRTECPLCWTDHISQRHATHRSTMPGCLYCQPARVAV